MDDLICPKCGCNNVYVDKKGYDLKKGVFGTVFTGNLLGLAGGLIGSNKIVCTCLGCGYSFKPEEAQSAAKLRNIIDNCTSKPNEYSYQSEKVLSQNDISGYDILDDLKKDALNAEFNEDYDEANLQWSMCLDHLSSTGKDLDIKIAEKTIACARDHGNPFRLMGVYEILLENWPTHPEAQKWRENLDKLQENPFP